MVAIFKCHYWATEKMTNVIHLFSVLYITLLTEFAVNYHGGQVEIIA